MRSEESDKPGQKQGDEAATPCAKTDSKAVAKEERMRLEWRYSLQSKSSVLIGENLLLPAPEAARCVVSGRTPWLGLGVCNSVHRPIDKDSLEDRPGIRGGGCHGGRVSCGVGAGFTARTPGHDGDHRRLCPQIERVIHDRARDRGPGGQFYTGRAAFSAGSGRCVSRIPSAFAVRCGVADFVA